MMLVVQKFGGTSVADVRCIRNVCRKIKQEYDRGNKLVVVVSAMAGETNRLIELTKSISLTPESDEYDVVTASGEQVSCGLVAIALRETGVKSRSLMSWQIPIRTDGLHSQARFTEIQSDTIRSLLDADIVPIIPGFQGLSPENRLTTLGRGGSDITAVALAATLKADRCDIYTDVNGVYTADPRIEPQARCLEKISYPEMLELSSLGAKVLQNRSVELAMKYQVPLRVLSSFEQGNGTMIVQESSHLEGSTISSVTHTNHETLVSLNGVRSLSELSPALFNRLVPLNVTCDVISFDEPTSQLKIVIPTEHETRVTALLKEEPFKSQVAQVEINPEITKISVVGLGLKQSPSILATLTEILADHKIQLHGMVQGETRLSALIPKSYAELVVRLLHKAYKLGEIKEVA